MSDARKPCPHGHLPRSCELCDLIEQRDEAEAKLARLREIVEPLVELGKKATGGPWRHTCYISGTQNVEFPGSKGIAFVDAILAADGQGITMQTDSRNLIDVLHVRADAGNDADPERSANAALIVALRNALPLIAEALKGDGRA